MDRRRRLTPRQRIIKRATLKMIREQDIGDAWYWVTSSVDQHNTEEMQYWINSNYSAKNRMARQAIVEYEMIYCIRERSGKCLFTNEECEALMNGDMSEAENDDPYRMIRISEVTRRENVKLWGRLIYKYPEARFKTTVNADGEAIRDYVQISTQVTVDMSGISLNGIDISDEGINTLIKQLREAQKLFAEIENQRI